MSLSLAVGWGNAQLSWLSSQYLGLFTEVLGRTERISALMLLSMKDYCAEQRGFVKAKAKAKSGQLLHPGRAGQRLGRKERRFSKWPSFKSCLLAF